MDWDHDRLGDDHRRTAHWGSLDEDLLFDPVRYAAYATAHHVSGHSWAAAFVEQPSRSVALRLVDPTGLLPPICHEKRTYVEATSVVVEALAIEAVVHRVHGRGFGIDWEVDWDTVGEHVDSCRTDAARRGCRASGSVSSLLGDSLWTRSMGWRALHDWTGLTALADALGRGRVLEADQVATELAR